MIEVKTNFIFNVVINDAENKNQTSTSFSMKSLLASLDNSYIQYFLVKSLLSSIQSNTFVERDVAADSILEYKLHG